MLWEGAQHVERRFHLSRLLEMEFASDVRIWLLRPHVGSDLRKGFNGFASLSAERKDIDRIYAQVGEGL